jgi:hypothetical protein
MFENIFSFLRDAIVIGYLFVLRIGVPIIVTMFLGWWLERKLAEWDAKDIAALEQAKASEKEHSETQVPVKIKM